MKNLVELTSVGCHIDFAERVVYPTLKNGLPDMACPTDLFNGDSEEWWDSLSPNDTLRILDGLIMAEHWNWKMIQNSIYKKIN